MTYKVVISAAGPEPVTVGQVRAHTRIDDTASDALLLDYIAASREWIEDVAGLLLRACTATFVFDVLGDPVTLPRSPIGSVTSITYFDSANVSTVLPNTDYLLRERLGRSEIIAANGDSWPAIYPLSEVVVVTSAGYASPNDVPTELRVTLYRMVAHMYEKRGIDGGLETFVSQLTNNRRW